MEKRLSLSLLEKIPVFRMFPNELMRKDWESKSLTGASAPYMEGLAAETIQGVKGSFGYGIVKQSGILNTNEMLDGFRKLLQRSSSILAERFKYPDLRLNDGEIRYGNILARGIIFCEGHGFRNNPYFGSLPFRETRGDIMIIRSEGLKLPGIIHNKVNIVPLGDFRFWVGATFRKDFSTDAEKESFEMLRRQVNATISAPYKVVYTASGTRPNVIDRRPVIGRHPGYKNVFIFNGMGSRGIMLAPYFAGQMGRHILQGGALDEEADVARFSESG